MGTKARAAPRALGERTRTTAEGRLLTAGEVAWIATPACALAVLALALALGGPLGGALFPPRGRAFWDWAAPIVRPEPTEHARYLLALLLPVLIAAVVVATARRVRAKGPVRHIAWLAQALLAGLLVACLVAQHTRLYHRLFTRSLVHPDPPSHRVFFTLPTIAVAAGLALALVVALRDARLRPRISAWLRETTPRRSLALGLAVLLTGAWVLAAANTETSIGQANDAVTANVPYWIDETFAVLDGRAPLATFHAQYAQLWPYVTAAVMSALGTSFGVFAATMIAASGAAVLAVFAVLRRIVRSSLAALALYAPFLATGFFLERGPLEDRYAPVTAFSMFPMRYAGPYLLAWLTARHVRRPGHALPLFLAAGLVAINNVEFGLPALAATGAALACSGPPLTLRRAGRLLADAALGLAAAVLVVAALTLAVAGALPHLDALLEFPRVYGIEGFGMLPMPALGLHVIVFATFVAALVVATVRAVERADDVLLTAMLAWAGVFGLGAGAYFVGRSHPEVLVDLFSAWALALVLLAIVVLRALATGAGRRPTLPQLAVLVGLGLAICSLAQTPAPWSQLARLRREAAPRFVPRAAERFIAQTTRPGEHVLILSELGHRAAYDLGLVNVMPYAQGASMPLVEQMRAAVAAARREHVRRAFYRWNEFSVEHEALLKAAGYRIPRDDARARMTELALAPRARGGARPQRAG